MRFALRALHETQAKTQFSQVVAPPSERGMTWSMVNSSLPGWHAAILAGRVVAA